MTVPHPLLDGLPLVAILRGLDPAEAVDIGEALVSAGFSVIEVPLNSPEPFESIRALADRFTDQAQFGAGTVLTSDAARAVAAAGDRLCVMLHFDAEVVRAAKAW